MLRPNKSPQSASLSLRDAHSRPTLQPGGQSVARFVSRTPDLESGGQGGEREQLVQIRHQGSARAMDALDRRKRQLFPFMRRSRNDDDDGDDDDESGGESGDSKQLRSSSRRRTSNNAARRPQQLFTDVNDDGGGGSKLPTPTASNRSGRGGGGGLDPHAVTLSQMGLSPPTAVGETGADDAVQYTLLGRRKVRGGVVGRVNAAAHDQSMFGEEVAGCRGPCMCFDPNKTVNKFLHWTFRTSFLMLFLAFIVMFFVATGGFAGLILWSGHYNPQCIAPSTYSYSDRTADAYALSWTTFSTVGYGLIYPQVATDRKACIGLKFLCSVEAFLGVLFAGFCGAVLFAKVSRIQAHAQVLFSDPIVIKYGSGVAPEYPDASTVGGESVEGEGGDDVGFKPIQCPVLEFRIVNKLHSTLGGEIMDATLKVCASIDAEQACPSLRRSVDPLKRRLRKKLKGHRRKESQQLDVTDHPALMASAITSSTASPGSEASELANPTLIASMTANQEVIEDSSKLAARRIFSKLEIETAEHPFFKRVWLARHVLDENSPLLSKEARKLVKKNCGLWPEALNSHTAVRNSVEFDNLLVSLSGTCNVNVATVFAHKTYDFVDVNVGYEFANLLYHDRTGGLRVDMTVLNDVREQYGGGGEPFGFLGDEADHTANENV